MLCTIAVKTVDTQAAEVDSLDYLPFPLFVEDGMN